MSACVFKRVNLVENGMVSLEYAPSKSIYARVYVYQGSDELLIYKLLKGKFKEKIKIHTKYKKSSETADIILEAKVI